MAARVKQAVQDLRGVGRQCTRDNKWNDGVTGRPWDNRMPNVKVQMPIKSEAQMTKE